MGKQAKAKTNTVTRTVNCPHTGKVLTFPGTKAGRNRMMRAPDDPARSHDGPRFKSNPKRFKNGKKICKEGYRDNPHT